MATNGNIDYGNNGNSIPTKGVSSNMVNRQAKREFSNQFWEPDVGYLAKATEELKNQNKAMLEILNTDTKLRKAQKDRLDLNLKENDKIIAKLNKMRDTQEASFKDILDTMDDASTAVNNSLKAQNKLLDRNSDSYQEQLEYITKTREEIDRMNLSAKEAAQTIKKTQGSFAKGMSETLNTISSEFMELSNMFNLSDIANGKINTFVKSKLETQNDIMKQFGMQSVNQYVSLKNNMDSTLASMNKDFNNMFNSTDLKNYMSNLSSLGITDSAVAQEQMRNSMIATKYLNTSTETQQEIFKYMKRTNDYSMLDNHNKTIVGILKAQLGVSTEQLDLMAQQALNEVDALAGLGLSADVQGNFVESYTKSQAALTNLYGEDAANSIMSAVSEFANSSLHDIDTLSSKYGLSAGQAYHSFINTGDTEELIKYLINSGGFAFNNVPDAAARATLRDSLGQDSNFNAAVLAADTSKYVEKMSDITEAIKNGGSIDDFINNTTEVTAVDKIANWLDSFINGLDWASYIDLSTAAFGLWGAGKVFDIIDFFGKADKLNIANIGDNIKSIGSVLTGPVGWAAIAAAILSIANVVTLNSASDKYSVDSGDVDYAQSVLSSKGNKLASNSDFANVYAQSLEDDKKGLGTTFMAGISNASVGLVGQTWSKYVSKNYKKLNLESWKRFFAAHAMSLDADEITALKMMYSILLNEVGYGDIAYNNWGIDKDLITEYIKQTPNSESLLNWAYKYFSNSSEPGVFMPVDREGNKFNKAFSLKEYGIGGIGDIGIGGGGRDMSFKPYGITAGYPYYPSGKRHRGVDFAFQSGTPIGASVGGTVQYVKDSGSSGYGRHVLVHGADGKYYLYGHMSKPMVSNGQQITSGQLLGYSGNTGNSTGPHLHYEVRNSASYGSDIDPYPYINSSLWNVGEASAMPVAGTVTSDTEGTQGTSINSMPIATRRALPSDFAKTAGVGGTEAIIDSNDSNMNKLIRFLSGIKGEQDVNREILMAYSRANASSNINI